MERKTLRDWFNPRRMWLWRQRRRDIERRAQEFCPRPYDLGAMLFEVRTGINRPSPKRLAVYKPQAPTSSAEPWASNDQGRQPKRGEVAISLDHWIAGGEALALYGANVAEHFLAIDSHVYEAMSRLTQSNIDNISDLSSAIGGWDHSIWTGLPPSGLSMFAGHLGEVYVAEDLVKSGVAVQWPETSNQQGWDLLIQGHEINVKTVSDASELHQHFATNPDIAVVVPADMGHTPDGAFYLHPGDSVDGALSRFLETHPDHAVIVDQGLSHKEVLDQAAHATDGALGGASAIDIHFPWVTFATAGWRELKLLKGARTDLLSAMKNLGVDVSFRGAGAAGGAKGGAILGGLIFGPIGAGVLAVIGGMMGALFGQNKANELKRRPLRQAIEQLEGIVEQSGRVEAAAAADAASVFEVAKQAEQQELRERALQEKQQVAEAIEWARSARKAAEQLPPRVARIMVDMAQRELDVASDRIDERLRTYSSVRRLLWPNEEILAYEFAAERCRDAKAEVESTFNVLRQGGGSISRKDLHGLLARLGVARTLVATDLRLAEESRRSAEAQIRGRIEEARARLANLRAAAFARLTLQARELAENVRALLVPWADKYAVQAKRVAIEAQKLGAM
jgi:hypothetical protein